MSRAKALLVLCALLGASRAEAVPFHGCTLWLPQFLPYWQSCSHFRISYNCRVRHCEPGFCYYLPGFRFTGWFPQHMLEVTNKPGMSAFTRAMTPILNAQMSNAAANWQARGDLVRPPFGPTSTRPQPQTDDAEFSLLFGRSLPMILGTPAWNFTSIGVSPGTHYPTFACYSAVTEMAAETWADTAISGDRVLAARWAPITAPACSAASPILDVIRRVPVGRGGMPETTGCAFNLTPDWQHNMAVTGEDAYDPLQQCTGVLGGLLPRTGVIDGNLWDAAQRAAWRTASLAKDYWRAGVGVRSDDKWQVMWPPTPVPVCFPPGSLTRPTTNDRRSKNLRRPAYDAPAVPGSAVVSEQVFAVWRYHRSRCMDLWDAPEVEGELALFQTVHQGLCVGINAAYPYPAVE